MDEKGRNAAQEAGSAKAMLECAARELTWSECGVEQKVERLRQVLQSVQQQLAETATQAQVAEAVAIEHVHDLGGTVAVRPQRTGNLANRLAFDSLRGYRRFDPLA